MSTKQAGKTETKVPAKEGGDANKKQADSNQRTPARLTNLSQGEK